MSSSLLTTFAVLKANWNANRDYLSNFEPFVGETLKTWTAGDEVKPEILRKRLCEEFSLPEIPINTAELLRDRATKAGYVRRARGNAYIPVRDKLDALPSMKATVADIGRHITQLEDAVIAYARDVHALDWTQADAEAAIQRFIDEFSVELALARRSGVLANNGNHQDERLAVVSGFARRAIERDQTNLEYLEEMVRGSILANVLYFQDLGSWKPTMPHLIVYLDTTIVIRLLGLAPDPAVEAAEELRQLLKSFGVGMRVFQHTVVEIQGVLEGVAAGLRQARQEHVDLQQHITVNREVLDHLVKKGTDPADVAAIIGDLDRLIFKAGIQSVDTPDYPDRPDFDEAKLDELLQEFVGYKSASARAKDGKSLVAVHLLRGGAEPRELGAARAVFVTSNTKLTRASSRYFRDARLASPVTHCLTDLSLTTQLWLRAPLTHPDVPRKLLIAESYAALDPGPALWERYITAIERQREAGNIDDVQVKSLVYSDMAREAFLEVTHGDPDAVDAETPIAVIARYESELQRPVKERAEQATADAEAVAAERDRLQATVIEKDARLREQADVISEQSTKLSELERWVQAREARDGLARRRWPRVVAGVVAVAAVIAAVVLPIAGVVSGGISIIALAAACIFVAVIAGATAMGQRHALVGARWRKTALVVAFAIVASLAAGTASGHDWKWMLVLFVGGLGAASAVVQIHTIWRDEAPHSPGSAAT
jgi:hypothetical protein